MNEELRSARPRRLETGREEFQSINEELSTVNQELKSKVEELSRSNSDLQNLMAATQIATVFLDRDLCIQRYTPARCGAFQSDPNRRGPPALRPDAAPRLSASRHGRLPGAGSTWQHRRSGSTPIHGRTPFPGPDAALPHDRATISPGVVLTFVDITRRRGGGPNCAPARARFRAVADLVPDLLFSTDPGRAN